MSISSLDPSSLSLGSLRVIRDRSQAKVDQYGHQEESEELDRQSFENYYLFYKKFYKIVLTIWFVEVILFSSFVLFIVGTWDWCELKLNDVESFCVLSFYMEWIGERRVVTVFHKFYSISVIVSSNSSVGRCGG